MTAIEFLGGVLIAGGGAAAVVLAVLKTVGGSYLSHQFSKQLEAIKAGAARELASHTAREQAIAGRETQQIERQRQRLVVVWDAL